MVDRVIVVTGGGSGIGKAIAQKFADAHDHVIIMGRTESKLRATSDEIGDNVSYIVADVSQRNSIENAIQQITEQYSTIHVIVNNAGFVRGLHVGIPLDEAETIWEQEVGTNLKGAMLLSVGLSAHLSRPKGRIINIGSIAAYTGGSRGGVIGYAAAKAGLHGLTVALARELSSDGITVNTISPGLIVDTDFFGGQLSPERIQAVSDAVPVGRPGHPSEIAETVFFLASDGASYITGEVLHVNGGWLFGH
ncbi:MAG: SDR family NAD(P)-dependent oxidoreductase [Chloroflexota bacterium]